MANTTFNPSDKTANCTLTGSNLIATSAAAGSNHVRAVDRQITGKFYWECTCNTITVAGTGVAIYSPTFPFTSSFTAAGSIGSCGLGSLGNIYVDGTSVLSGFGSITNGMVVCIAVDATARLVWFRIGAAGLWNVSASANPATGTGGVPVFLGGGIPIYPAACFATSGNQITANFGDTAFTGAVPSGFTSGFTAGATINTNALATQLVLEEWGSGTPAAQLTQILIEEWASVASGAPVYDASAQAIAMVLA